VIAPEPQPEPETEPTAVETTEAELQPEYNPMKFTNRVREVLTTYGFEVPDSDEPEDLIAVIRGILDRVERDPNRQELDALLARSEEQELINDNQDESIGTVDQDDGTQGTLRTSGRTAGGRVTFQGVELQDSE
jgi:hypothetical protein